VLAAVARVPVVTTSVSPPLTGRSSEWKAPPAANGGRGTPTVSVACSATLDRVIVPVVENMDTRTKQVLALRVTVKVSVLVAAVLPELTINGTAVKLLEPSCPILGLLFFCLFSEPNRFSLVTVIAAMV
jgi:hypothetical protein